MIIAKIPGHDLYLATKCGKVLSLRYRKVRVLKPHAHPKGHLMVALWKDGGQRTQTVHHLVLKAFVGPPAEGQVCRHLNGQPADNRLENLRWGTPKENSQDMVRHGNARKSRFSAEQIEEMKTMPGSQTEVAKKFGVSQSYISMIRNGRGPRN